MHKRLLAGVLFLVVSCYGMESQEGVTITEISPFYKKIDEYNLPEIQRMIIDGENVNKPCVTFPDGSYMTPLGFAITKTLFPSFANYQDVVTLLLKSGADPDTYGELQSDAPQSTLGFLLNASSEEKFNSDNWYSAYSLLRCYGASPEKDGEEYSQWVLTLLSTGLQYLEKGPDYASDALVKGALKISLLDLDPLHEKQSKINGIFKNLDEIENISEMLDKHRKFLEGLSYEIKKELDAKETDYIAKHVAQHKKSTLKTIMQAQQTGRLFASDLLRDDQHNTLVYGDRKYWLSKKRTFNLPTKNNI